MPRRLFLKLAGVIFLPRIRAPQTVALQAVYGGLIYSDSEATDPAMLGVLGDAMTTSGGIIYGA